MVGRLDGKLFLSVLLHMDKQGMLTTTCQNKPVDCEHSALLSIYTRFQCYVHRRQLPSFFDMPSFDMLFKRLFNCETGNFSYCAVPENIHTPPTEGIGISWGVGGSVSRKKFKDMYEA